MKKYISPLKVVSPTFHATVFFSISVFAAIVAMSYIFKVEIVSQGIGKVIPVSRVQVVQPEFGGAIQEIHVQNGALVSRGDLLILLDPTDASSEVNTLQGEAERLEVERQRIVIFLKATLGPVGFSKQVAHKALDEFSALPVLKNAEFFDQQRELLRAEMIALQDGLAQIDARILANKRSEDVTRAGISRTEAAIETQDERLQIITSLLEKGTASRSTYLDVFDNFTRLENEREILLRELDQKASQETALVSEKASMVSNLRNQLLSRKIEINGRMFELEERLVSANRRFASTRLISPVDGIVDQLNVYTIGGIVDGGQELLRIVPVDEAYEIEAIFSNKDVGFLEVGQTTNIKLDAFPSERFGAVKGTIISVSADAIELGENTFGFVVRIKPNTSFLETSTNQYPMHSGMTSVVDVITGERRIISYFFAPILKVVENAMGER